MSSLSILRMKKYVKFICGNSAKFIWIFSMSLSKKPTKIHSRHLQNGQLPSKSETRLKKINDASKIF